MMLNEDYTLIGCPCCGHPKKMTTMMSGNTFGASFWSDGVKVFPMILSYPDVIQCKMCYSFFWFQDKLEINISEFTKLGYKIARGADHVKKLSVNQYYEAIESNFCKTPDVEKKLRISAWRRWNDMLRGNGDMSVFSTPDRQFLWKDNLNKLLNFLDDDVEIDCLIKGEILRNLSRFEEAKDILYKIKNPELQNLISQLISFCDNNEFMLKRIKL